MMSEPKQSVPVAYCLDFSIVPPVTDLLKRGLEDLAYLFVPEDTADNGERKRKDSHSLKENSIRSTVKVAFWLVVSVTLSLALGQLQ
jgi:hypothetical protein